MKVFAYSFSGVWLGGDAVIVADDADEAAEILAAKLEAVRLPQRVIPDDMVEIDTSRPTAVILNDGDY